MAGVRFSGQTAERLRELLQAYGVEYHLNTAKFLEDPPEGTIAAPDPDGAQAHRKEAAAELVANYGPSTLTTADGIQHAFSYRDARRLAEMETAESFNLSILVLRQDLDISVNVTLSRWNFNSPLHVTVKAPEERIRGVVSDVKSILEAAVDAALLAPIRPMGVFIGHGNDRQWEAVRNYLEPVCDVVAFETNERAGSLVFDQIERMISNASVAVIVLTGADQMTDGTRAPRQNVIHELGFAHGRLGIANTLLLVEENITLPSNVAGIAQIRFNTGEIHTTQERVLRAVRERQADFSSGIYLESRGL